MADTQLYLGLDLGPEYTQLSYYNMETREPESVYHKEAKDTYMLPNIMFYSAYDKRAGESKNDCYRFINLSGWCTGARASACRFEEKGVIVDQVYEKTLTNENIEVEGRSFKASDLLVKMMALHMRQFTEQFDSFVIKKLTVTVTDTDPRIIRAVRGLKTALRLTDDQFNIVSHLDSGLCYIFAQPEPLRNNSVGLFDFGRDGLDFYRIDMTRKYPLIVTVEHESFHDRMNLKRFGRNHEDMDEAFLDIVKECMSQVYISSVYLTGIGFGENWMKLSAEALCKGRRVFVGQNIYTKGACYRSLGGIYTESLSRYFIDTEQTVKTNIGINLMDEKKTFWPIAYGGLEWFNTRGRVELFLDDTRRVQIVYQDILSEDELRETIEIYGLPARPKKTTKLSIEVEYYGADKGAIVIRDLGFGSLYPSTNKIYRKEFDIAAIKRKHEAKLEAARREEELRIRMGDTEELRSDDPVVESSAAETDIPAKREVTDYVHDIDRQDIPAAAVVKVDNRTEDQDEPEMYYGTASPVAEDKAVEPEITEAEVPESETTETEVPESETTESEVPEPETTEPEFAEAEDIEADIEPETSELEKNEISDEITDEITEDTSDDEEPEEYEERTFSIPSYLRGQHFDPGE